MASKYKTADYVADTHGTVYVIEGVLNRDNHETEYCVCRVRANGEVSEHVEVMVESALDTPDNMKNKIVEAANSKGAAMSNIVAKAKEKKNKKDEEGGTDVEGGGVIVG